MIGRCIAAAIFVFACCGSHTEAQVTLDAEQEIYANPVALAFGTKVAISDDIAVVGNIYGILIYERGSNGWAQIALVNSYLGGTTAIHSLAMAGEVIVVGVPSDTTAGPSNAGAAYVIQRGGTGAWVVTNQLLAADPDQAHFFGRSVSIDGEWLFVGASGDDDVGPSAGAVYVFSTTSWTQVQKLVGNTPGSLSSENFGDAVSVRNGWAAIGTTFDGAYAFREIGGIWILEEFFPPPPQPTIFGCFVAADGPLIVVPDSWSTNPGVAYVYEFDGAAWSETLVTTSVPEIGGFFGAPVDIRGGRILFAEGGRDAQGIDSGRASLFEKVAGVWTEVAYLLPSDVAAFDYFGYSVAHDDAGHVIIGAPFDDSVGPNAGSAHLFYIGDGFRRGDSNGDGGLDIADAITVLGAVFGAPPLACDDAADANDDGDLDIADPIAILNWLFVPASPALPVPSATCGDDPTTDALDCAGAVSCL